MEIVIAIGKITHIAKATMWMLKTIGDIETPSQTTTASD
jgi:hypothetical protein